VAYRTYNPLVLERDLVGNLSFITKTSSQKPENRQKRLCQFILVTNHPSADQACARKEIKELLYFHWDIVILSIVLSEPKRSKAKKGQKIKREAE
jgi:hypothetical protein